MKAGLSSRLVYSFTGPWEILKIFSNNAQVRHWKELTDVRTANIRYLHPYTPRDNYLLMDAPPSSHISVTGNAPDASYHVGNMVIVKNDAWKPNWRLCKLVEKLAQKPSDPAQPWVIHFYESSSKRADVCKRDYFPAWVDEVDDMEVYSSSKDPGYIPKQVEVYQNAMSEPFVLSQKKNIPKPVWTRIIEGGWVACIAVAVSV